jgi:hypothetical protein
MGLFDFLRKKKIPTKKTTSKKNLDEGVKALKKIMSAKNDQDFLAGMMDLPTNKKKSLSFKSVNDCFEYMEKFFSNYELETKSLYHGKILQIDKTGTAAYVKVLCLINGRTDYAIVTAEKGEECKSQLKKGDMVYVGVEQINKTIDNTVRRWEKTMTEKDYAGGGLYPNSFVSIVKKLKLNLNIISSQFDYEN